MRSLSFVCLCVVLLSATAASADSHVFIVANQPDGYGVDHCLANGEKCGSYAAHAYCQSREFTEATAYRRLEPAEITGALPVAVAETCSHRGCGDYVAITCQR
jgi:hypothetical protein